MIERTEDTDQLSSLLSLAQMQDAQDVRRRFCELLEQAFPGHRFTILNVAEPEENEQDTDEDALKLPVASPRHRFGVLRASPVMDNEVDVTTIRNLAAILAVLLENLARRDVLLNEVHHRAKNNMQIILSLLNLQEDVCSAPESEKTFTQIRSRITAMALVHEQLCHSDTMSTISVRPYLGDLISSLRQSYERPGSRWRFAVSCDDLTLGLEQCVPFGLLVTELVSNALKHADGQAPELHISVREEADATVRFEVGDNGPGIPDHNTNGLTGIGLTLVDSLVRQLGGEVERESAGGTRWSIRFRVKG